MREEDYYEKRNHSFNKAINEFVSPLRISVKEKLLDLAKKKYKILVVSNSIYNTDNSSGGFQRFINHKKYKSLICIKNKNNYLPILAHEIGHAITLKEKPLLNYLQTVGRNWESGLVNGKYRIFKYSFIVRYIYRFIIRSEILASKKGIELLKECGYKKEDLIYAKRYYKLALGTYINAYKYYKKIYLL